MKKSSHAWWPGIFLVIILLLVTEHSFSQQPQWIYLNELPDVHPSSFAKKSVELALGDPEGGRFLIASQAGGNRIMVTKVDELGEPIWMKSHSTPPGGQYPFYLADFIRFEYMDDYVFALLTFTQHGTSETDELWKPNLLLLEGNGNIIDAYDYLVEDPNMGSMRRFFPKKLVWDENESVLVILGSLSNTPDLAAHYNEQEDENLVLFSVNVDGIVQAGEMYDINTSFNGPVDLYLDESDPGYWVLTNEWSIPASLVGSNVFKVDNSLNILGQSADIYPSSNSDLIFSTGWSYFEENNDRYFVVYGQLRDQPTTIGYYNQFLYTFSLDNALNCPGTCFSTGIPHFHIPGTLDETIMDGALISGENPPVFVNGSEVKYQTVGVNDYGLDFHPGIHYYKLTGAGASIVGSVELSDVDGAFFDILAEENPSQAASLYVNRFMSGVTRPASNNMVRNPLILHRPDVVKGLIDDQCEVQLTPLSYLYTAEMGASDITQATAAIKDLELQVVQRDEERDFIVLCDYFFLNNLDKTGETREVRESTAGLWPNPVSAGQNVQVNLSVHTDTRLTLRMFNTLGQEVHRNTVNAFAGTQQKVEINTENLHAGVYFLRAEQGKELLWSETLVIE